MHLLTLNAGSSSIKFALFAIPEGDTAWSRPVWMGQAEGLGAGLQARIRMQGESGQLLHQAALADATQSGALAALLEWRQTHAGGVDISAVGHRIVHGGLHFTAPVRLDEHVLAQLTALEPLAPLHQPQNLAGVRAAMKAFAGVPQVGCFDTAFHASEPEVNRRFAIPRGLHDAGVQRYGFHGLSYESIVAQLQASDPGCLSGRVVVAHLGNGASMCALRGGRSVATTMSFSPLDGLPMGTRSGRLDPAVVLYLLREGRSADEVEHLLFRECGLLGLSGVSSDLRTLEASKAPDAAFAIDYFVEYAVRELAGMAAALRGLDLVVFTGGIGENAQQVRERIAHESAWLGSHAVRVLRTDEESVIARHTRAVLGAV
jgi:acetate kinase